jgi:hypothetical protein
MIGERRSVEELAVEVAGDEAEGGTDGPDDDEDPRRDGRAAVQRSPILM